MPKKHYLTDENSIHRKVKKHYLTDENGIHRKVKKAYASIGGVWRPYWSGGELTYYGTLDPLSEQWSGHAATTVGEFALFVGGTHTTTKAFAYNKSLTRIDCDDLVVSRQNLAVTTVGNVAVIGGGNTYDGRAESYDSTLLVHHISEDAPITRRVLAATTVGNSAVFGGGRGSENESSKVDYCNASLTFGGARALRSERDSLAATTVGETAIFAGGGTYSRVVDMYDASVTQLNRSDYLRTARKNLAATTVGDYGLFVGGRTSTSGESKEVDAFSASLTQIYTVEDLSVARFGILATTIAELAMFVGGRQYIETNRFAGRNEVDVYDSLLNHKTETHPLSIGRGEGAATTLGSFAIFVGGYGYATGLSYTEPNTVDVYTV